LKELNKKPNERIDTLEEIIDERDDDMNTLKKEIDGAPQTPKSPLTKLTGHCLRDDEPKSKTHPA